MAGGASLGYRLFAAKGRRIDYRNSRNTLGVKSLLSVEMVSNGHAHQIVYPDTQILHVLATRVSFSLPNHFNEKCSSPNSFLLYCRQDHDLVVLLKMQNQRSVILKLVNLSSSIFIMCTCSAKDSENDNLRHEYSALLSDGIYPPWTSSMGTLGFHGSNAGHRLSRG